MSQYKIRAVFLKRKPASQWQKPFGLPGANQSDWKVRNSCRPRLRCCKPSMLARGVGRYAEIFGNYTAGVNFRGKFPIRLWEASYS